MKKIIPVILLILALLISAACAESAKDESNTALGTSGIPNPDPPGDKDSPWSGSYVYFGAYGGNPIRFRVLATDSTAYTTGGALFLDSDEALFDEDFDRAEPYSNSWYGSSIRDILNGAFLEGFSAPEQATIAISTGDGDCSGHLISWGVPVSICDRVFLLDPAELMNVAYGYFPDEGGYFEGGRWRPHTVRNHKKGGSPRTGCWMLRTAVMEGSEFLGWHICAVSYDGAFITKNATNTGRYAGSSEIGAAPAMNIDQASVLFATSTGTGADEFKLTVFDSRLAMTVPDSGTVSADGTTVTVPYLIAGGSAADTTRASVLILDKEYIPGNTNHAKILFYRAVGSAADRAGSFTLPDGLDPDGWGNEYYVYIFSENLNGPYETDYASVPVPLNRPGSSPAAGRLRVPEDDPPTPPAPKDGGNTCLGTSGISNPAPGSNGIPWSGSYVYFGTYGGKPIRFRVLAKDSTAYTSGKCLFLDSDRALFVDFFDRTEPISGAWDGSDIRGVLNGPFLDGFSAPEQAAIAVSAGNGGCAYAPDSPQESAYGAPVSIDDRVFLLDVGEVTNEAYGFSADPGWKYPRFPKEGADNRIKRGMFTFWWLRTASLEGPECVGDVNCSGILNNNISAGTYLGVAPALNVSQESILFSTSVGEDEFKLTVPDDSLEIRIPVGRTVSVQDRTVTVPYEIGGPDTGDATRASVLILDREYAAGNTNGARILFYDALEDAPDGCGSFTLPDGCSPDGWGNGYCVYILAENLNGLFETDYASAPVAIEAP